MSSAATEATPGRTQSAPSAPNEASRYRSSASPKPSTMTFCTSTKPSGSTLPWRRRRRLSRRPRSRPSLRSTASAWSSSWAASPASLPCTRRWHREAWTCASFPRFRLRWRDPTGWWSTSRAFWPRRATRLSVSRRVLARSTSRRRERTRGATPSSATSGRGSASGSSGRCRATSSTSIPPTWSGASPPTRTTPSTARSWVRTRCTGRSLVTRESPSAW